MSRMLIYSGWTNTWLNLTISLQGQDESANTSTVVVKVFVDGSTTGSYGYNALGDSIATINVNGTTRSSYFTWDFRDGQGGIPKTLLYSTITIPHNADGRATVNATATVNFTNDGFSGLDQNKVLSETLTLPSFSKADSFALTSSVVNQGSNIPVTMYKNGQATSYAAYIKMSQPGTAIISKTGLSTSMTSIPLTTSDWTTISSYFSGSQGNIYVEIRTLVNGVDVGGYYDIQAVKLSTAGPTISVPTYATNLSETNSAVTALGLTSQEGAIQNISAIKAVMPSVTPQPGTSVVSNSIQIREPSGTTTSYSSPTTFTPKQTGSYTISFVSRDSRDNSTTRSMTLNVMAYSVPRSQVFSAARTNSAGTADPNGTYAKVVYYIAGSRILVGGKDKNYIYHRIYKVGATPPAFSLALVNTTSNITITPGLISGLSTSDAGEFIIETKDSLTSTISTTRGMAGFSRIPVTFSDTGMSAGKIFDVNDTKGKSLQVGDTAHFWGDVLFEKGVSFVSGVGRISTVYNSATGGCVLFDNGIIIQWKLGSVYVGEEGGRFLGGSWLITMKELYFVGTSTYNSTDGSKTCYTSHGGGTTTEAGTMWVGGPRLFFTTNCVIWCIGKA